MKRATSSTSEDLINKYYPSILFYDIYENDIPLHNFKWRSGLCFCYSALQYIVRIPEINRLVLDYSNMTINDKNIININYNKDNLIENTIFNTLKEDKDILQVNYLNCNLDLNILFNIIKTISFPDNIYNLINRAYDIKCNRLNPDTKISNDKLETIYTIFIYKLLTNSILTTDTFDKINDYIINKGRNYIMNNILDCSIIYKQIYLISLYIIFIYLTLENPLNNQIFLKTYQLFINNFIDDKFNFETSADKIKYTNDEYLQNFIHLFIYIIGYDMTSKEHYNGGDVEIIFKNISFLFNIIIHNRSNKIYKLGEQICYILSSIKEGNQHYINVVLNNKDGQYYFLNSCITTSEQIDIQLLKNIRQSSRTQEYKERITKYTINNNGNQYAICNGGKNNTLFNQVYKSYYNKYYN